MKTLNKILLAIATFFILSKSILEALLEKDFRKYGIEVTYMGLVLALSIFTFAILLVK